MKNEKECPLNETLSCEDCRLYRHTSDILEQRENRDIDFKNDPLAFIKAHRIAGLSLSEANQKWKERGESLESERPGVGRCVFSEIADSLSNIDFRN